MKNSFGKGERIFLSFPLGIGLATLLMFFVGLFNIPFETVYLFIVFAFTDLVLILLAKALKVYTPEDLISQFSPRQLLKIVAGRNLEGIELFVVAIVIFLVLKSFLINLVWPPETWDALSLYDYRAQRYFESRSLAREIFTTGKNPEVSYNYSYPPLTSLAHAIVYLVGGENPMFIYSLFYISSIGAFFFLLRRSLSRKVSLIFAGLIAVDLEFTSHSTIAYTNLPYAIYLGFSSLYLLEWFKNNKSKLYVLSGIFLGLSTWTRTQEPLWASVLLFMIAPSLYKKKYLQIVIFALLFFSIRQPWLFYRQQIFSSLAARGFALLPTTFYLDFSKIIPSFIFVFKNLFLSRPTVSAAFLSALIFGISRRGLKKHLGLFVLLSLFLGVLVAGTYFFSINYKWWDQIGGSVTRLSMFIQLLFYYFVAKTFFEARTTNK